MKALEALRRSHATMPVVGGGLEHLRVSLDQHTMVVPKYAPPLVSLNLDAAPVAKPGEHHEEFYHARPLCVRFSKYRFRLLAMASDDAGTSDLVAALLLSGRN